MYLLTKKCHVNHVVAIFIAFMYMLTHPIISSWFGNSEFMGLGAAFLPFIIMAGVDIVQRRRIRILYLALPMAVILQIHLMTSLIAVLALVPFVLVGIVLTHHTIKMLINGTVAVIITALLSGNVLGTIYDIYSSNQLIPTYPVFHMQSMENALMLHSNHIEIPAGEFLLIVILLYAIFQWKHLRILDWTILVDGLGFLWLSSAYFPWDHLWPIWPKISSIIQFPARFLPVALLLLLLLLGRIITNVWERAVIRPWPSINRSVLSLFMIVIFIVTLVPNMSYIKWASSTVWNRNYVVHFNGGISKHRFDGPLLRSAYRSHNLHRGLTIVNKITTDYLPTPHQMTQKGYYSSPIYRDYAKAYINNPIHFKKQVKSHQINLSWRLPGKANLNNLGQIGMTRKRILVPVTDYRHSIVRLNGHRIDPKKSLVGAIQLRLKRGVTNHLSIQYQPGEFFKVMSTLSIVGWLLMLCYGLYKLMKFVKNSLHKA